MIDAKEAAANFAVSEKRRAVWETELDILRQIIRICDKYNLKYFAGSGTLLGTVRHGGIIPWDDDIDVEMLREDYDKFVSVAQSELPKNMFLQHFSTEKLYMNGHAQIRNSDTTALISTSYSDLKAGKNCGVFVDIFVLDFVPDEYKERVKLTKKIRRKKKFLDWYIHGGGSPLKRVVKYLLSHARFLFSDPQKEIEKFDKFVKNYTKDRQKISQYSFAPRDNDRAVFDAKWFESAVKLKFNDMEINCPCGFEHVLKNLYGDYMKVPKIGGGSVHGDCYFDLEKPYYEYADITEEEMLNLIKNYKM